MHTALPDAVRLICHCLPCLQDALAAFRANGLVDARCQAKELYHARVPVLKFVDSASGCDCDVTVGNSAGIFKGLTLKHMVAIDARFPALIRLVKAWAKAQGINNAYEKTFNSFALTLMVMFHLQQRQPPVLPPLCKIFQELDNTVLKRPLHDGRQPDFTVLQAFEMRAKYWKIVAARNSESLLQLLTSFFQVFTEALESWKEDRGKRRCSTWAGKWFDRSWPGMRPGFYVASIEDPFDSTDNPGRSVDRYSAIKILAAFKAATEALNNANDASASEVMRKLFG